MAGNVRDYDTAAVMLDKRFGQALTEAERSTLQALLQSDHLTAREVGVMLAIHENSAKYRLNSVKAKWGMVNASTWQR